MKLPVLHEYFGSPADQVFALGIEDSVQQSLREQPPIWAPGINRHLPIAQGLVIACPTWYSNNQLLDYSGHGYHGDLVNFVCPCTRCTGGTPSTISVNILGNDYVLPHIGDAGGAGNCVWQLSVNETIGCADATLIQLFIAIDINDDLTWNLTVNNPVDGITHAYSSEPLGSIDCLDTYELERNGGLCAGSETATITPVAQPLPHAVGK